MQKNLLKIVFYVVFILISPVLLASQPLPQPPLTNPHPPVTDADKKRVAFAEKIINTLLKQPISYAAPALPVSPSFLNNSPLRLNIDAACLDNPECLKNNTGLPDYLRSFITTYSLLTNYQHVHIIPWSFDDFEKKRLKNNADTKDSFAAGGVSHPDAPPMTPPPMTAPQLTNDEYMLHVYTQFENRAYWHHMDIIVSEDKDGNLVLRRLFIIPLPYYPMDLPHGVVC